MVRDHPLNTTGTRRARVIRHYEPRVEADDDTDTNTWRVEISSTNRAGCKATKCKDDGVKILKGELRFGVWVTSRDFQSWQWRHW